ncbi:hypothetical protein KI387_022747 [Taxus chinensis]|uniref:Uncharacterized protein n=1 Tax=Taxus chinensis TaxID=29808 RepID=A0AA38LA74_TAXCH|nr:hypothetical protein KI387_022747 [Taxus chinensis]
MRHEGRLHRKVRSCMRIKDISDADHGHGDGKGDAHGPFKCLPLKVGSSKPTNHSKFTGKCRRARCKFCHLDPPCKLRRKIKGCRKHTSSDLLSSLRLCLWRVADHQFTGLKFAGLSALYFINFFNRDDDDDSDCDEDSMVTTNEEEEEESIQVPVKRQVEEKEDEMREFSSCESESWTIGLSNGEWEEWRFVDSEDSPCP